MHGDPISSVEEAVNLLRRQDAAAWVRYLVGAVPWLLALIWFVHDMSAGYFAARCAPEALLCTAVFFWSSVWKARFGGSLRAGMSPAQGRLPVAGFWRVLYLQGVMQTIKLLVLPFAIVSVLPSVWVAGFFRHAAMEANQSKAGLRGVFTASARRASRHARDNWLSMGILAAVYFLVLSNAAALVIGLPWLVRTLTGSENEWTRHVTSLFSLDVLCAVFVIAWLPMDALLQAHAAVQAFYADARRDGGDLLAKLSLAAALALGVTVVPTWSAPSTVAGPQIAKAVQRAAESDDYGWLRVHEETRHYGPAEALLNRLKEDLAAVGRAIDRATAALGKWLRGLFKQKRLKGSEAASRGANRDVRFLMYGLALLVVAVGVFLFVRKKPAAVLPELSGRTAASDLSRENPLAFDLPEDEWLQLARELMAKGEPRLALRAMYLANLSYLGSAHFIRIARAKTNSTYERELSMRPGMREACAPFARANRKFERVWYGFDSITADFIDGFQQDAEAIRRHARA